MNLTEQIFAHALVLIRDMEEENQPLLETLCRSAELGLGAKLREGITPEDCRADFVAAASLYAVAAMAEVAQVQFPEQVDLGDLTVRRASSDAASCCLRYQAELMMLPYLQDRFTFVGV